MTSFIFIRSCSAAEPAFSALKEDCIFLNTAYIESRYPVNRPTNYTKETADRSHSAAVNIARVVRYQLGI